MNPAWIPPLVLAIPGYLAVERWLPEFDRAGRIGLALLLGMAGGPLLLFAAHLLGAPLTRGTVFALLGTAVTLLTAALVARRRADPAESSAATRASDGAWLPVEWLVAAVTAALLLAAAWKGDFYPISATDAHSYDGRARWIVAEKTLDLSVYASLRATGATNISYPPVYPLALAIGYWSGGTQAKVVDSVFLTALVLVLASAVRREQTRLGGLLAGLLLAATPEVWNHASLGLINLPAMAFLAAAFLVAPARREAGAPERADAPGWWLAGLLAAGAAGIRNDAAVLTLAGAAVVLPGCRRPLRHGLALVLPALAVTLLWQFYLKFRLGLLNSEPFRAGLVAGPATIAHVGDALVRILFHGPLFAYIFYLLLAALIVTLAGRLWRAAWAAGPLDPALRPLTLLAAWGAALVALFQALDPKFGGGLEEILRTSFKRVTFYLLPPAIAGLLLLPPVRNGLRAFERWQRGDS